MSFPTQGLLRGLYAKPPELFSSPEYQQLLRSLCSQDQVRCVSCGFEAQHEHLEEFVQERHGAKGSEVAGYGLFCLKALDHNLYNLDIANVRVVCEPCQHAAHVLLPGLVLKGDIGLLGGMTQAQVILAWRTLSLAAASQQDPEKFLGTSWNSLTATARQALVRALGEPAHSTLRINNFDLAYWLGHTQEHIYTAAGQVLLDLRFIPGVGHFVDHLDFCAKYQPLPAYEDPAAHASAPEAETA